MQNKIKIIDGLCCKTNQTMRQDVSQCDAQCGSNSANDGGFAKNAHHQLFSCDTDYAFGGKDFPTLHDGERHRVVNEKCTDNQGQ